MKTITIIAQDGKEQSLKAEDNQEINLTIGPPPEQAAHNIVEIRGVLGDYQSITIIDKE